ncbi:general substrate transporter [Dacryopinax primogenitus]|uniref:General substrate transporter n=1 Tax=Dacryopinax primogenitus (strain DJM 731) TaxID=1858805 RepID=M5FVX6_DACPD|nr:general substrate transporter [Dacryopinax primogenitus]EJU00514.1 general substrate transporter [Dacryopinax primogenitus]
MAGGAVLEEKHEEAQRDVNGPRVEAPITIRAYLTCLFAAFGGILFGYDSGYINGVQAMTTWKNQFGHLLSDGTVNVTSSESSLIVSILSAGTFFGAISAGYFADAMGRRYTIIMACGVFTLGVIIQMAAANVSTLAGGRFVAGLGVGIISATVILYMSEIAPKKIRGALVSGYQFAITVGLLLSTVVTYATENRTNSGAYRIPIAIQFLWAIILATGLLVLPESPRYWVRKGHLDKATQSLVRVRGQPAESEYIQAELAEIQANYEYELSIQQSGWIDVFRGGFHPAGNFRRVMIGTFLQMFQQWTGINFIFYYGNVFFQQSGIQNSFTISMATTAVNVGSTPASWWLIEKFGRRSLLIWGAAGMFVCEFIIAGVGVGLPGSQAATICLIVFICIYISFFAVTWGPAAWVVIGELFPLPIRAKGVALSTASNWFWNCIIAVITPYLVGTQPGDANLGPRVFFIWGSLCFTCFAFAFFLIPETKGLSLEQVDRMLEETTPMTSAKWRPHDTFAGDRKDVEHHEHKETVV